MPVASDWSGPGGCVDRSVLGGGAGRGGAAPAATQHAVAVAGDKTWPAQTAERRCTAERRVQSGTAPSRAERWTDGHGARRDAVSPPKAGAVSRSDAPARDGPPCTIGSKISVPRS